MQRPMVTLTLAFAMGIWVADRVRPHPVLAGMVLLAGLMGVVWSRRGGAAALRWLVLAALAAGAVRYAQIRYLGPGALGDWLDQRVEVVGTVRRVRESDSQWRAELWVEAIRPAGGAGWQTGAGGVWVRYRFRGTGPRPGLPAEGERVQAAGALVLPERANWPGQFDLQEYLARWQIFLLLDARDPPVSLGPGRLPWPLAVARSVRERLVVVLRAALPPAKASLLAGLILGLREGIPGAWEEAFRETGVLHILAASGANVAFVVLPFRRLVQRLGAGSRLSAILATGAAWFYCLLAGADPPVTRAALMATVYYLGEAQQRPVDGFHSLAVAGLLLLAWQPELLFDLGFQLSFAATLGILTLARPVNGWLQPRLPGAMANVLAVTLAAAVAVEPLLLYHFGFVSLISPIANLWVALVAEAAVLLGTLGLMAGLVVPLVAAPALGLVSLLLEALVWPVVWWSHAPGAALEVGRVPLAGVLVWYGTVLSVRCRFAVGNLARQWAGSGAARLRRLLPVTGLALLAVGIAVASFQAGRSVAVSRSLPDRRLEMHFIDVGQGDAILIRFPGGGSMLVDGGGQGEEAGIHFDAGRQRILPLLHELQVERLDWIVVTHPHQDHVGGLAAVVGAVPVGEIWDPGTPGEAPGYAALLAEAGRKGVPVRQVGAGAHLRPGDGSLVQVLNPGPWSGADPNSRSLVLLVRYGHQAFLLTGDLDSGTEARLLAGAEPLAATVLKAGHHGSGTSSSQEFLTAVGMRVAVLTVGANPFGHPSPTVVERLRGAGAAIYRTDRHGTISFFTDGDRLYVSTGRHPWPAGRARWVGAW